MVNVNLTNLTHPLITVEKNVTQIYKGGKITGVSVDEIKGLLFIADSQKK